MSVKVASPEKRKVLGFLMTHPIQYYAPLFRYLTAHANFDVKVFYQSDCSVKGYFIEGYNRTVAWDNDLLGGYNFEFLPSIGGKSELSRLRPISFGLRGRLRSSSVDVLFIGGYNRPFHLLAVWLCWRLGVKSVLRDDSTLLSKQRGKVKNLLKKWYFKYFTLLGVDFLAVGAANRAYYIANGVPLRHIRTMHWAVDSEFFKETAARDEKFLMSIREGLGLENAKTIFLFVGRLIEHKGIRQLLSAFRTVYNESRSNIALVFVGDGKLMSFIEDEARSCDGIKPVGFKNQSELSIYYSLCDLLVLPSLTFETWGLVVNEAMSLGKPAIVSDCVGCGPDLIDPGKTGWIYETGNEDMLANCLREASNIKSWQHYNENCKQKISRYSYEANLKSLEEILGPEKSDG